MKPQFKIMLIGICINICTLFSMGADNHRVFVQKNRTTTESLITHKNRALQNASDRLYGYGPNVLTELRNGKFLYDETATDYKNNSYRTDQGASEFIKSDQIHELVELQQHIKDLKLDPCISQVQRNSIRIYYITKQQRIYDEINTFLEFQRKNLKLIEKGLSLIPPYPIKQKSIETPTPPPLEKQAQYSSTVQETDDQASLAKTTIMNIEKQTDTATTPCATTGFTSTKTVTTTTLALTNTTTPAISGGIQQKEVVKWIPLVLAVKEYVQNKAKTKTD